MVSKKNWDKVEDGKEIETWINKVTGEEVTLEGSDGEHYLWNRYMNEGLDANMPRLDKEFSNRNKAHKKANEYMDNNTGRDVVVKPIEEIIGNKLHEKTSRHPKDSWGVRHDKQNESVDNWEDTPEMQIDVYSDGVTIYASVYHYLTTHLENTEYSAQMTEMLHKMIDEGDLRYNEAMKQFTGESGQNTANTDNILSQGLQYILFESVRNGEIEPISDIHDANYIALQIHQGGDTRGGYTKPVILEVQDIDYFIIGQSDLSASTTDEEGNRLNWYSDDSGYNWYEGDGEGQDNWEFKPDENKVIYGPSGNEITFTSTAVGY